MNQVSRDIIVTGLVQSKAMNEVHNEAATLYDDVTPCMMM